MPVPGWVRLPNSFGISPVNWLSEEQPFQVGQAPQLRRYLPGQLVAEERQLCQVGQVAQLRRYLPGQPLSCRCSSSRLVRPPNSAGISPVNSLSAEGAALPGWSGSPNSAGISPVNWLLERFQPSSRLVRLPNSAGISPVNWLLESDSPSRLVRLPNSAGISPVNWLS